jgi:tetratricopeptide (TPR) repeat protein
MQAAAGTRSSTYRPTASLSITDQQDRDNSNSKLLPTVLLPSSSHPEDLYSRASQNGRESMVMRMEKIFDEVEARLASMAAAEEEEESPFDLDNFSSELEDSTSERRLRHLSKPVVIGDSIPPPLHCPPVVQHVRSPLSLSDDNSLPVPQSLEAALAHHNLGSYEESLKYLETAKVQLYESERDKILQKKRQERKKLLSTTDKAENLDPSANIKIEVLDSEVSLPADVNFYVLACKGNVYQSCGDDEQSLLQYLSAWEAALVGQHHDWEMLFINSIGLLAYYNLHFELALRCFHKVSRYRERVTLSSPPLLLSLTRSTAAGVWLTKC